MTINQGLHSKANGNRLCLSREGGKGLISSKNCVNIKNRALGQCLKMRQEE